MCCFRLIPPKVSEPGTVGEWGGGGAKLAGMIDGRPQTKSRPDIAATPRFGLLFYSLLCNLCTFSADGKMPSCRSRFPRL